MTLVVAGLLGVVFAASATVAALAWRGFTVPRWANNRPLPGRHLMSVRGVAPMVLGLLALVVTRWLAAAGLVALAVIVVPRVFAGRQTHRVQLARTEALAAWAEQLRDTLAAAAGLEATILATVKVAPLAIRPELSRLARRLERHRLAPCLGVLADELGDPLADLIVSALFLGAEREVKDLGALLSALAETAREEAGMQLRVDTGRARTRSAVQIITAFTLVFATGMVVLNHRYLEPFDSPVGQAILLLVGGCFATAFWIMERMSQAPEPERVLIGHLGHEAGGW